jgi:hypothetical protein
VLAVLQRAGALDQNKVSPTLVEKLRPASAYQSAERGTKLRITGDSLLYQVSTCLRIGWGVTLILIVAGFFFSLLAFAPFRVGSKGYLYCLGIAVVTPFSVEKFLETWAKERLLKAVTAVTLCSRLRTS